ncbi:glycosyltransferase [Cognatitamlana onchidii]|uniref:glycosyltransferase n=1 Tax=Cognatitamlana onchidii TaxID=2562860 RepID=UPI0010A66DA6|nr:glycosyltransferase [Algibacter onchidii]
MNVAHFNVLHVIDTLGIGGAEKMALLGVNGLNKAHVNVALLLLLNRGELFNELESDVKVFELKRRKIWSYSSLKQCAFIINQYDVIHVHMRYNYKYIRLVQLLFGVKTKVILHDHYGSIDTDVSVPSFFKIFKPAYYIGVSESLTSWATSKLNIKPKSVFVLPNTISRAIYPTPEKEGDKGLVMVGNIKPVKNQLFAIKLAHELKAHLTIFGKVQDKDYFALLKDEIARLNYHDFINFNHETTNIQEQLKHYKLALHCALSESGPLVLIEYMAQNLSFLSYSTGEVYRTIGQKTPKLFIDTFNLSSWKQRVLELETFNEYDLNIIYSSSFSEKRYIKNCLAIYSKLN